MERSSAKHNRLIPFFVLNVLINLSANFAHPITPTLIKELNLGDSMFGICLATMQIANFLFSPFWGKLNSYISSRKTLFLCCTGYAIGQLWFGAATTKPMIIAARFFSGIFVGGVFVSILTYVINLSSPENQGRNLTISATITSVASAFGYTIGGFLGEISIQFTFLMQATCLFGCGVLSYLICKDDSTLDLHTISRKKLIKDANPFTCLLDGRLFMTVSFALLFLVIVLQNFGGTAYDQCFNYYIKDQFGFTSSYNGILKGVIGLIALASNSTICMWMIQRTNVQRSIIGVFAACCVTTLGVMWAERPIPFILFNVIFFGFNAVSIPLLQHLVALKARSNSNSNLIMGFYNGIKSLGAILGSLISGFVYAYGAKISFVLAGLAFLLACFSCLILLKRQPASNS